MAGEITDAELLAKEKAISARQVKFGPPSESVNLPGGENYREVLLTLPEKQVPEVGLPAGYEVFPLDGHPTAKYALSNPNGVGSPVGGNTLEEAIENARLKLSRITESGGRLGGQPFTAGHMNEPNVLAWVRMDDRIGPNGERILFLQEVQSDWLQKGRELRVAEIERIAEKNNITKEEAAKLVPDDFGYANPEKLARLKEQRAKILAKRDDATPDWWPRLEELTDKRVTESLAELTPAERDEYLNLIAKREVFDKATGDALKEIDSQIASLVGSVPDAPFKKTWHEMSLRRVIRMAAEEGYDSVAWTPGKIQAERYDLSKQISAVHWSGSDFKAYDLDGATAISRTGVRAEDLPELIGKEAADRLIAQEKHGSWKSLEGIDLQIGGEGMAGFYDKMLTAFAAKFGKKFGAKVGTTKVNTTAPGGPGPFALPDDVRVFHDLSEELWSDLSLSERQQLRREAEEAGVGLTEVWTIPITPKMRESVLKKGVAMFSAGAGVAVAAEGSANGS